MTIDWNRAKSPTGCVSFSIAVTVALFGLGMPYVLASIGVPTILGVLLCIAFLVVAFAIPVMSLRPDFEYQRLGINSYDAPEVWIRETKRTPADQKFLRKVKDQISAAPSLDEAFHILCRQNHSGIRLANPALQPIAFAIKLPDTTSKGATLEVLVWVGAILSVPVTLFLLSIPFLLIYLLPLLLTLIISAVSYMRRLNYRAIQYQLTPHRILESDPRPPILYLRPFSEDYPESIEGFNPSTTEERLIIHYANYGPPIAVGGAAEAPPLPTPRIYFEEEDTTWRAAVLYLMFVSQLVIIQAGFAEGLLWELGMARQRVEPRRLLISFHAWDDMVLETRYIQYLRFKKLAEELLSCTLPPKIGYLKSLAFTHNWEAYWS